MNPQPLDDYQESSHVELGEGVGRRLRAARIDRGFDLERVAAQLHLNPFVVDALEAGRYEALPGPLFVAGYIRNYARLVGLDPEPLVTAYHSAEGHAEPVRVMTQARATRRDRGGSGILIRLMTVAVVAVVAYLFVQWWQNRAPTLPELPGESAAVVEPEGTDATPERQGTAAEGPQAVADDDQQRPAGDVTVGRTDEPPPHAVRPAVPLNPVVEVPPPAALPPPPTALLPEALQTESAPAAEPSEVAGAPEVSAEPTPDQGTTDQASPDEGDVVLEFRGPCWVDVRDSAKSFSLTAEMAAGDRRVLGGVPPYSLILGNASAASVMVKGVPFDLTRVTKGNVARFKLDPAKLP